MPVCVRDRRALNFSVTPDPIDHQYFGCGPILVKFSRISLLPRQAGKQSPSPARTVGMLSFRPAYKPRSHRQPRVGGGQHAVTLGGGERTFKLPPHKPELRVGGKQGGPLVGVGGGVGLGDAVGH